MAHDLAPRKHFDFPMCGCMRCRWPRPPPGPRRSHRAPHRLSDQPPGQYRSAL